MSALQAVAAKLAGRADEVRSACIEELARVLKIEPADVDVSSDFDSLGLDSIDALGAISDRLGVDLPPELLFVNRTLDAAVRAMTHGHESAHPLQERTRAFWFPGGGILDDPLIIDFRARLDDAGRFGVIHVGGWRHWRREGHRFDDLVATALAQIQCSAPVGPLLFAGDSQGGQLAYATALAAKGAGREVAGVILFDTASTYSKQSTPAVVRGFVRRGSELLRSRKERSFGDFRSWLAWYTEQLAIGVLSPELLMWFVDRWGSRWLKGPRGMLLDRRLQMIAFGVLWGAWQKTRRVPLDVPSVLLRSDERGPQDHGWGSSLPRLKIVPVSGGHRTMFAPENVPGLHDTFRREMRLFRNRSVADWETEVGDASCHGEASGAR